MNFFILQKPDNSMHLTFRIISRQLFVSQKQTRVLNKTILQTLLLLPLTSLIMHMAPVLVSLKSAPGTKAKLNICVTTTR